MNKKIFLMISLGHHHPKSSSSTRKCCFHRFQEKIMNIMNEVEERKCIKMNEEVLPFLAH